MHADRIAALLLPLALSLPAVAAPPPRAAPAPAAAPTTDPSAQLEALASAFYQADMRARPGTATDLGIHTFDGELEDFSPAAVARQRALLTRTAKLLADFEAGAGARLPPARQIDLTLLSHGVRSRLLELDKVQGYRRYANFYPDLASAAVYVLIQRDFAPEAERLRAVIARERKIPGLLAQGQKNLAGVPQVSIDILHQQLGGIVDFFATDVPRAFPHALDGSNKALKADFERANAQAMAALRAYGQFVDKRVAKGAKADFAIGEALFKEKLAADEMIDTPVEQLLAEGEGELQRLRDLFQKTAGRISADMLPSQVQRVVSSDFPRPDKLIANVQARLAGLRWFLVEHKIVTVPSEVMPRVQETPAFMRSMTMASMFTPGPFEKKATDAMYNVTLPEKDWAKEKVDDYMRGAFNRPLMDIVSIHEAFPGHYTQFLWMPRIQSTVRKYEHVSSNAEGWAHYCEQMMLDEGWGNGDDKLRLAQLQDALLRAARYVAGIRMHTRGMTVAQATAFFRDQGFQTQQVAEVEARRGTEDPTYLYYTWGKLRLLELREAYKKKLGAAYTLQKFHDAVLAEGAIPLPLLRRALVP